MISACILFIQTHVLPLGAFGVFVASIIEEVLAPIPSAMVIFGSGFLLVSGPISIENLAILFLKVALPASAGVVVGSLFVYYLAYTLGRPVLNRWGKWLGFSWTDIERIQQKFSQSKFDEWSLFIIRAIPIVPSVVISAFCGLVRFPIRSYVAYSFLGLCIRTTVLGFLGWQIGELYFEYAQIINVFEDAVLVGAIVFVILYLGARKMKKAREQMPINSI